MPADRSKLHPETATGSVWPDDERLTTKEVARRTGFTRRALESRRHRRQEPRFTRIGRLIRYRWGDVRAWLEKDQSES